MNPQVQRIVVALSYALAAVVATFQLTGMPQTPEAWISLVVAAIVAGWGKYSSSTTVIAANRAVWTPEERKIEQSK